MSASPARILAEEERDETQPTLDQTLSGAELDDLQAKRARQDPIAFLSYVLRDEETNQTIKMRPMHLEWQRTVSTYRRTLIKAHIESGKTSQLSIGRTLWELGRNPSLRIAILSNTGGQASKIAMTIGRYITESPELHKVFPALRPAKDMPWTRSTLFVDRPTTAKDASVQCIGIHGNLLGSRIDYLIVDDILDYENTLTQAHRDALMAWFTSTVEGRLTRRARVVCVGTAWQRDDFLHRLQRRGDFRTQRYPLVNAFGESTWPEKWPAERIAEKRLALGSLEAARQLDCIPRSDDESRFKDSWINQCLALGEGRQLTHGLDHVPPGCAVFTGVDLSVGSSKDKGDYTALVTILLHPDETRELLDISRGRWKGPEIVERIVDIHYRYQSLILVENNASQEFIVQFTKKLSAVPVKSFTTGKHNLLNPEFGIESLATEMEQGKWVLPSRGGKPATPEIAVFVQEMLSYDPAAHKGDVLMAAWFAREAARRYRDKKVVRQGHLDLVTR